MPRILIAECKQEVSSFNPVPSHYEDFDVSHGQEMLLFHRGGRLEVGGALGVLESDATIEIVPTYSARARTSAGTLAAPDWARIARGFLGSLQEAPTVDGVYFSLHGAMSAADEDDPEGFILSETRKILGEKVPIVVSLDLHAVLTDRMLHHADATVVYHTYPHRDFRETGERAIRLLLRILAGQARPVSARVAIPALVRGDELKTETGLLGGLIRRAQAIEASPSGLSAAMVIGNPFTDVPDLRCSSLVTTDDDPTRASSEALALATDFWQVRHRLQAHLTPIAEAMRIASNTAGTVILTDAADAPSSGATGDSNAILRALLETDYRGRALIPIVAPAVVAAAMSAGVGATLRVALGGELDAARFRPCEVEARVRLLSDGHYASEYSDTPAQAGDTAVLQVGSLTVVATSRTVSLTDRSLFLAHGQDPRRCDLVVVKSPHCHHEFFEDWAARMVNVDAPGSTSANLHSLGHVKCRRPIFPLDPSVAFVPEVQIYRRGR